MTPDKRSKIIEAAMRLREIPYDDAHDRQAWRDLTARPRALDGSAFVCRVVADAGLYRPGLLTPEATWLLDYFEEIPEPSVGDLVGYARLAPGRASARFRDVACQVMIYAGNGDVVGACDIARRVVVRRMEYERNLGSREWKLIEPSPFRALRVIS